jgi:DNA-directed RNA polymerase subunit M/transcription elongation factor TFIIS
MDIIDIEINNMLLEMNIDNPYNDIKDKFILYDYILYQYDRFKKNLPFDENFKIYDQKIYDKAKKFESITDKIIEDPIKICSSVYKCTCGSDNISYNLQQIRSADEGMTVFIKCNNCGKEWTEN